MSGCASSSPPGAVEEPGLGKALAWHGVRDGCRGALRLALEAELEDRARLEFRLPVCLLLSLGLYPQAYNLLRWFSSSPGARPHQRCPGEGGLGRDMAGWREAGGDWSPADSWSRDAEPHSEALTWVLGREGRVRDGAPKVARVLVGQEDTDYLHTALPVTLTILAALEECREVRSGFLTFLLGTHPRLGQDSPVLAIAGLSPVIRRIARSEHSVWASIGSLCLGLYFTFTLLRNTKAPMC